MSFPTKITFKTDIVTGANGDRQGNLGHATIHNNLGSILNELQDKIGVDGSTDPNSLDYKVNHLINDDDVAYNHIQITDGTTSTYGITFGTIDLFKESAITLRTNGYLSVGSGVGISNGNFEINNANGVYRISDGVGNYDVSLARQSAGVWRMTGNLGVVSGQLTIGIADTVMGELVLAGSPTSSTEGGQVQLQLAADYDTVFDSWVVDVNQDDLRIFSSDGAVVNKFTAEGQLQLEKQGSAGGIVIGLDCNLYRLSANNLRTDDFFIAGIGIEYGGFAQSFTSSTAGGIKFSGASDGAYDVNLYALPSTVLRTDGYFSSGTGLGTDADSVRVVTPKTPASAAATGDKGQIAWDTNFMYVCVNTNTWKRVAITTW